MSFICGKETKLLTIKSLSVNNLSDVYRVDLEANKQGLLICSGSGILRIISWINKKLAHKEKRIENVSDALWQQGGESEVIVTCESGALLRYNLHYDTGITCSLQLSAPSVLQLIKSKDPNISSLKHVQICGHTKSHILLQPQSDRLILFNTNSGDRPNLVGVLKVPPVRTAYLMDGKILVQPITGCDLHIYSAATCKAIEVLTMTYPLCDTVYKEWGRLSCSAEGSYICLTDSERKLYLGTLGHKVSHGKKSGVLQSTITLNQIVWPSSIKPIFFCHFTITCSEDAISVFCTKFVDNKEASSYLLCKLKDNRSLSSIHNFKEEVVVIPTLANDFQDFFLTNDGMSMLIDKESSSGLSNLGSDMKKLLVSLEEAFKSQDMNRVAEIKSTIEQDLSIFLSSCNYKDGWPDDAKIRCDQHYQLADMILSHLMSLSANSEYRATMIVLKEMAEHHFQKLKEEMENALAYVDSKNVSQLLLQMIEQMRFFMTNLNDINYPEDVKEEREILENFEKWKGKSVQEIVRSALESGSVATAQSYLQMKPWIYGKFDTDTLLSLCLNVVKDSSSVELLFNLDKNYTPELKHRLYNSRDASEIRVLFAVLRHWNALDDQEKISIHLIQVLLSTFPALVTKPLRFWSELVAESERKKDIWLYELSVGVVKRWKYNTIMLLLCDLYARSNEPGVISYVNSESLWHYFLVRSDEPMIRKWISKYFNLGEDALSPFTVTWTNEEVIGVSDFLSQNESSSIIVQRRENKRGVGSNRMSSDTQSLLGHSAYDSDAESASSFSRSSLSGSVEDLSRIHELTVPYLEVAWNESLFGELNQGMVDMIQYVAPNFAEDILNFLSQFHIFLSSEKTTVEDIFRRKVCRNQIVPSKPTHFKGQLSNDQLSLMVLKKYSSLRLHLPFFEYVRDGNINTTDFELHLPEDQWFHLTKYFLALSSSPRSETVFACGTKSLEYLVSLGKVHILMPAFLTMLVSPYNTLREYIDQDSPTSDEDGTKRLYASLRALSLTPKSLIEQLSMSFPFLKGLTDITSNEQLDITVYDLLRGNVTFDISTLFTWQEKNSLGFQPGSQLPDFLDGTLSELEGAKFNLDYIYYLQRGRPTKALFSAYADIYENEKYEKLSDIEENIYGLALSSWPDRSVCSACVAFLFLSDSDAVLLRSILHAADTVIQLLTRKEQSCFQREISLVTQEIKEIFLQLCCQFSRKTAASRFIAIIEETAVVVMTTGEKALHSQREGWHQFEVPISEKKMFNLVNCLKMCNFLSHYYEVDPPHYILETIARNNLWPVFLALIQSFQYPKESMLKMARQFSSMPLKEHLSYALSNVHRYRGKIQDDMQKKSRSTLSLGQSNTSPSSTSSCSEKSGISPSPNDSMADMFTVASTTAEEPVFSSRPQRDDLLSVFITCYRSADPVKALLNAAIAFSSPVLSALAACFAKADVNQCFVVYLYSLLPPRWCYTVHKIMGYRSENKMEFSELSAHDNELTIKNLFTVLLSHNGIDMLEEGIRIFYKGHPFINILIVFSSIRHGNYPESGKSQFHSECSCLKKYSSRNCLLNMAAIELIGTGLDEYLTSNHMRKMFLGYLLDTTYANIVPIDWNLIYAIYRLLEQKPTAIKSYDIILNLNQDKIKLVGEKVTNFFIETGDYSEAAEIGILFGLKPDNIVASNLESEFTRKPKHQMEGFFRQCVTTLQHHAVNANCAVQLFLRLSGKVADKYSEYLSLCGALFWCNEDSYTDTAESVAVKEVIERKLWLALVESNEPLNTSPPLEFTKWPWEADSAIRSLDYDFVVSKTLVRGVPIEDRVLNEKATMLVEEFMKNDIVITGIRINNMFALDNKNVKGLLNIMKASSKILYALSPFMLDQVEGFEIVSCATSSSDVTNSESAQDPAIPNDPEILASDMIGAVKNLIKEFPSNNKVKQNILTFCNVAQLCSISFLDLVRCESHTQILRYMLSQDKGDFELVKDFIKAVPIESESVENFLYETVTSSLDCANLSDCTYGFSGYKLSHDWSNMIGLLANSTALGNRLLQTTVLYKEYSDDAFKAHSKSVDLMVYAHKCLENSANIEGIGLLLNSCRPLVDSCANFGFWSLMSKLLIGLRRYNELHYVIDILKERGEFEHLLCKISERNFKTSGLDRALVHYLKCKYPEDRETLKLVARHFLMHSEVAEMWQTEANELIDNGINEAVCTSSEHPDAANPVTKFFSYFSPPQKTANQQGRCEVHFLKAASSVALLEAMHCYSCAANCCLRGGMLIRALWYSRQAELTALQVALVRSAGSNGLALKILKISPAMLSVILSQYLSVKEIILVSKAYDVNIDWVSAIFNHFIVKGRQTFLSNFLLLSHLTPDIVLGIVKRMETTNFDSENVSNLSILLKHIDDPELVYRVASQFQMAETLDTCLSSPSVDFLKDTTFKKGLSGSLDRRY